MVVGDAGPPRCYDHEVSLTENWGGALATVAIAIRGGELE
jgi:hypothetical protein